MKIKRVLQGTALTALAAAAWMGAGSTDASAAISASDVIYSGGQELEINSSGAKEIVVGIAKVSNKGAKVSAWDVYDGDSASVNLSKVNVTKEAYIAVKTDADEVPIFIKIDAAAKKNKATFNAGTRIVTFESDGTKLGAVEPAGETYGIIDYDNDVWTEGGLDTSKAFISETAQYQGATIYLYGAGKEYTDTDKKEEDIKDITDSKEGKTTKVYTVGKFPTKQVKLNIPKQANGPAVPVDYVKGTVKIKKGVEVRVVGNNRSSVTSDSAIVDKTLSVSDLFSDTFGNAAEAKGTLEVRVAAKTDTAKGKAASKWTRVAIEKPVDISGNTSTTGTVTTGAATSATATVSGAAVELQFTSVRNTGAFNNGITITNKTGNSFDYVLGTTTAPTPDAKGVVTGSKTLKDTKKATIKNIKDNDIIWVRVTGNKSEKQWASAWAPLYTVAVPK